MATKEEIQASSEALTEAMGHSEVELVRLAEVRSEYRTQLKTTQEALAREAELEAAHEALMLSHEPTPPPAE